MAVMNIDQSVVTSQDALREQRLDVQLRQLEFNALLHRKLDLDLLFECLLTEGQTFVAFDGLQYIASDAGHDLLLGASRQHRQRFELKLGDRSLGEVILMRGKKFSSREERDAERLVESLVYPLDNALHHYNAVLRAMTDGATGLRNQSALDQQLPREIRLVRRVEEPLSLMLISVDYLESISEHHGSDVGEQAWQSVSEALTMRLRQTDHIFRTEDDCFCIVLTQTPLDGAMALAERLRQKVDRCVSYDNVQFVLTASAGVTELGTTDDADTLVDRARDALKSARTGGRNQVCSMPAPEASDGPTAA